jgi:hypothetical protein
MDESRCSDLMTGTGARHLQRVANASVIMRRRAELTLGDAPP